MKSVGLRYGRARRSHSMAHAPIGPDLDRDGWLRPRETLGRPDRGDSAGGRGLELVTQATGLW